MLEWMLLVFMARTRCASVIGEVLSILINSTIFRIKVTEEIQGPIGFIARRVGATNSTSKEELVSSKDSSNRQEEENDRGTNFDVNSVEGGSNIRVIVDGVVS